MTTTPSHLVLDADEDDRVPKSVLGKAQLLLGAFGAGAFSLRLTELSERSGVPKATAYRLAQELVHWGLLDRIGDGYQLGLRVFELGQRVPLVAVLRGVARPLLADLFATTRGTVHLAVLEGSHVLYVEKFAGEANVHTHSAVGGRLPATCTATGKVLLALRPGAAAALEGAVPLRILQPTSRSPRSLPALQAQLDRVRQLGYAVELEETLVGYGSVAVPVVGLDGGAYAAVSVTMPVHQLRVGGLVTHLQATAAGISRAVEVEMLGRRRNTADLSGLIGTTAG